MFSNKLNRYWIVLTILFCGISFSIVSGDEIILKSSDYLKVKAESEIYVNQCAIRFDLASIPENALIEDAFIVVNMELDTAISTPLNLIAYPVTESWEKSVTPSNTVPAYKDSLILIGIPRGKAAQDIEFQARDLVQAWISEELSNNGIIITILEQPKSKMDVNLKPSGAIAELHVIYSDGPDKR